ncbi:MAG: FAD-dependent thymidylate synthase, partial [Treponema sp.]|nr:FAD-dependent thymidylate synthase [Treponema sp.]
MIQVFDSTDKFPLQKIGKMAGVCWNSPIDSEEKNIKRAKDCIISGHGRVLEYVDIEICISGYSARAIREYYTHIAGGPTRLQESTRYVNCNKFEYFTPSSIKNNPDSLKEYNDCMDKIKESYARLVELGAPKEDVANIRPLGMMPRIVDKRNLRNMINLMNQRLCTRAYSEIRAMANE